MAKRVLTTAVTSCVAVAAVLLATQPCVEAQNDAPLVASDRTAGYIVFPHVELDRLGQFSAGRTVDTQFQLTNTATTGCRIVQCMYVDATKHCSNAPSVACRTSADCGGGSCGIFSGTAPDCREVLDFYVSLSPGQAIGWTAGEGASVPPDKDCQRDDLSTIPFIGNDVFFGELKCVELSSDRDGSPINVNDLKGEATIYETQGGVPGSLDVRSYNAVGLPTVSNDGLPTGLDWICLGATPAIGARCPVATNAACPATMVMNHWFDFARNPKTGQEFITDLILAPCSQNLTVAGPGIMPTTTVQFLIYNEFEQRFSTSTSLSCVRKLQLSQIDAGPGAEQYSVFSVYVQGTLTGQTRIRAVQGNELDVGHGIIGVMQEASGSGTPYGSSEANLAYTAPISGRADVVVGGPAP